MLLHVPKVLSPQQVQSIRQALHDAGDGAWADGRAYGMTSDPGYVQRDSVR